MYVLYSGILGLLGSYYTEYDLFMEVITLHISDSKVRSAPLHGLVNMIRLFETC